MAQSFSYTGAVQYFVVPAFITEITVDARGAQGQKNQLIASEYGGKGGRVLCDLTVTAGETLQINVGGQGGWNGGGNQGGTTEGWKGGNGGGASDVRRGAYALADRLVIAGGGGGTGGAGSGVGYAPTTGTDNTVNGISGTPTGGLGRTSGAGYQGGGGGTASAGGAAAGGSGNPATAGALGIGGGGGSSAEGGGGGGGGGRYGGGGGKGAPNGFYNGGGGGGGSGLSTGVAETLTSGFQLGNGEIILTYGPHAELYVAGSMTVVGQAAAPDRTLVFENPPAVATTSRIRV